MTGAGNLIRDAREQWVPKFEPTRSRRALRQLIGAEAVAQMDTLLASKSRRKLLIKVGWIVFAVLAVGCSGFALTLPGTDPIVLGLYIIVLATGAWFIRRRLSKSRWLLADSFERRDALLGIGRCASCAYSIDGIPPAIDACTVCPECGAAWRLDPTDIAGTRALTDSIGEPNARSD